MKNVVKIESNEILENATFNNVSMKNVIKNNILSDYKDGIKRVAISIIATDLYGAHWYNLNNKPSTAKLRNWANGEIIKINDLVIFFDENNGYKFINKDNPNLSNFFKVVDRKVRYEGQIFIDLVLEEQKRWEENGNME